MEVPTCEIVPQQVPSKTDGKQGLNSSYTPKPVHTGVCYLHPFHQLPKTSLLPNFASTPSYWCLHKEALQSPVLRVFSLHLLPWWPPVLCIKYDSYATDAQIYTDFPDISPEMADSYNQLPTWHLHFSKASQNLHVWSWAHVSPPIRNYLLLPPSSLSWQKETLSI